MQLSGPRLELHLEIYNQHSKKVSRIVKVQGYLRVFVIFVVYRHDATDNATFVPGPASSTTRLDPQRDRDAPTASNLTNRI